MAKRYIGTRNTSLFLKSKPVAISLGDLGMAEGFADAEAHFDSYGHLKSLELRSLRANILGVEFDFLNQINPFVLEDLRKKMGEEIANEKSEVGPNGREASY